jgi:hypothetical protein
MRKPDPQLAADVTTFGGAILFPPSIEVSEPTRHRVGELVTQYHREISVTWHDRETRTRPTWSRCVTRRAS